MIHQRRGQRSGVGRGKLPAGQRVLRPQQPVGLLVFLLQPMTLGLQQPAVLAQQLMTLRRPGHDPQQRPRGRRMGTKVGIGARLEAQRGHLLFAGFADDDQGFLGAAAAQPVDELQSVQRTRLVAHQHRVERLFAQSFQPRRAPCASSSVTSQALSLANDSASQAPVRRAEVTCSTRSRGGNKPRGVAGNVRLLSFTSVVMASTSMAPRVDRGGEW